MEVDSKENILSSANSMIQNRNQIKQEQKDFKYSILCVDDDQVIADHLCSFLNDQKYKTFSAYSAQEALEVLSKHHIDLVITDVVMPGMRSREILKTIKKMRPGTRVLLASGLSIDEIEKDLIKESDGFLSKPFIMSDLSQAIAMNPKKS